MLRCCSRYVSPAIWARRYYGTTGRGMRMAQDLSEVSPRLRRDVGLLSLFMVSAGSVIGSGWLLGTLNASKAAGPAALISWIIGVILLIGIALIYAELGSTYPISGS